jgi:hypothetical protein
MKFGLEHFLSLEKCSSLRCLHWDTRCSGRRFEPGERHWLCTRPSICPSLLGWPDPEPVKPDWSAPDRWQRGTSQTENPSKINILGSRFQTTKCHSTRAGWACKMPARFGLRLNTAWAYCIRLGLLRAWPGLQASVCTTGLAQNPGPCGVRLWVYVGSKSPNPKRP